MNTKEVPPQPLSLEQQEMETIKVIKERLLYLLDGIYEFKSGIETESIFAFSVVELIYSTVYDETIILRPTLQNLVRLIESIEQTFADE